MVLGVGPRASHMIDKPFTTGLAWLLAQLRRFVKSVYLHGCWELNSVFWKSNTCS